ncbi:MAG: FKBP-type peptidyl-prolyl cis-trans isomerase [Candidatus Micrarchaeaceae archaeon]
MGFNDGDFVKVEYTARRASDSSLVFTTEEKTARDEGAYSSETAYGPQLIVLGKKSALKGVEDAVKSMSVGETKKVTISPADGFGERDEKLVNVMRMSEFREKDVNPYPGMQVDIDGRIATVKSVNSGRVLVDMNHPLAGETLMYEIKVTGKVESDADKVKSLAEFYSLKPDSVSVNAGVAKVAFGEKVEKDEKYLVNKSVLAQSALRYLGDLKKVVFEEEYARPEEKKGA